MSAARDENDLLVAGELPADPAEGGVPYAPEPTSTPRPAGGAAWQNRVIPVESAWYTTPPPRREWLLRDRRTDNRTGVLPLGKVGQLVAEGGAGKTMALLQLGLAVATGTPWLGSFEIGKPGRVLLILGEEDPEEVHRRLYSAARACKLAAPPQDGQIVALPLAGVPSEMIENDGRGNPTEAGFLRWLRSIVDAYEDLQLVVLDPLSRFAGLDAEKDNALATRFVEAAESLAVQTGATVLVAHHTNQSSRGGSKVLTATSGRGVTALVDGVRWAAALQEERVPNLPPEADARLGAVVTLSFVKSNYSLKAEPLVLRRDTEHGGALVPLDDVDRQIVEGAHRAAAPGKRREAEKADRAKEKAREADTGVLELVKATPGILARDLRAQAKAKLGIGTDAATDSVRRVVASGAVRQEGDQRRGLRHFPVEVGS